MKKIVYILLALTAFFINSHAFAVEARTPTTCFSQALQNIKSRGDFVSLKSAKYNVKQKAYHITYLAKDGSVESIKISQIDGKEVK